jgi:hypothetical protein
MASRRKHRTMKHTKEHQKEKQWWLSLAYALGQLRGPLTTDHYEIPRPAGENAGLRDDADGRSARCFSN